MPRLTDDTDFPLDAALTGAEKVVFTEGTSIKKATLNDVGEHVASRLGVHNVLDYGAVGDGTTDDTAAIQAAIDAAEAAAGGVVRLPIGTYRISAALTITESFVEIEGAGWGTVLKRDSGSSYAMIAIDGGVPTCQGVQVRHIRLGDGVFTGSASARQVDITNATEWTLSDCYINNVTGIGVKVYSSWVGRIVGCSVERCGTGIDLGASANNITISQCRIRTQNAVGVNLLDGATLSSLTIRDCDIEGNAAEGIRIGTGAYRGVEIGGCHFEGNYFGTDGASLLIVAAGTLQGCIITGNKFDGAATQTVSLDIRRGDSLSVLGNGFVNHFGGGIGWVATGTGRRLIQNQSTGPAIQIAGPSINSRGATLQLENTGGEKWQLSAGIPGVSESGASLRNETTGATALYFLSSGKAWFVGEVEIDGAINHDGTTVGFNGSTPVGKRTLGAAATDAATTQTLANNLRQALIDLGLGQT